MRRQLRLMSLIFSGLLLATSLSAQQQVKMAKRNMTTENNKKLVMRLFDEVLNGRNLSVIDELYAPDVVDHSAFADQPAGVKGIHSAIEGFFGAFREFKVVVEDVIAEGNKVVTRETWTVTLGDSGKTAEGSIIHIFGLSEGKITDEWSKGWDWLEKL